LIKTFNARCFTTNGSYGSVSGKAYHGELKLTKVDAINKMLSQAAVFFCCSKLPQIYLKMADWYRRA
jgi:hypothetical protein